MIALIDADSLLYKIAYKFEEVIYWNKYEVNLAKEAGEVVEKEQSSLTWGSLADVLEAFDDLVSEIVEEVEADQYRLYFSDSHTFRHDNPLGYKQNRRGAHEYYWKNRLKDAVLKSNRPVVFREGLEADDLIVYDYNSLTAGSAVLCALDKDVLNNCVGMHFDYGKWYFLEVEEEDVIRYPFIQTLTGDVSDGYKGCKGIGAVKAKKLLQGLTEPLSLWRKVVETFKSRGHTEEDAINTMRLASMTQFNGENIELFDPNNTVWTHKAGGR